MHTQPSLTASTDVLYVRMYVSIGLLNLYRCTYLLNCTYVGLHQAHHLTWVSILSTAAIVEHQRVQRLCMDEGEADRRCE